MLVILSSSYMSWSLSVLLRLIAIIYEIGIILVNAQQIIDIPPISLSVNDQIFEFVRFGHKSISNILNRLSTDLKQNYFKDARSPPYYDIRRRHLNIVHIGIRNTCSAWHNALFHAIWYLAHLVLADSPLRMPDSWFFFVRDFCPKKYFASIPWRVRVAHWVR